MKNHYVLQTWISGEGLNYVDQFEKLPSYGRANQPFCSWPSTSLVDVLHLRFYVCGEKKSLKTERV